MSWFVDLDLAAEIIGHEWTTETVIEKVIANKLTAYARIPCFPSDGSTDTDSDDDEKYEIARITNLRKDPVSQSTERSEWFFIHYEPIDVVMDEYKGGDVGRLYGYLKSQSKNVDAVRKDQICMLRSDAQRLSSVDKGTEKTAAQILAETRHKTEERDSYVNKIMKRINEESKKAPIEYKVINHIKFIKDADVPSGLVNSVRNQVLLNIKSNYNDYYKPLSRRPNKHVKEHYFLLK